MESDLTSAILCAKCGCNMVKRYSDIVLATYPPQYPWDWWCACGHTAPGGVERGTTSEELLRNRWEEVNKVRQWKI